MVNLGNYWVRPGGNGIWVVWPGIGGLGFGLGGWLGAGLGFRCRFRVLVRSWG